MEKGCPPILSNEIPVEKESKFGPTMMTFIQQVGSILFLVILLVTKGEDHFNYAKTVGNNYGPEDWDQVGCSDVSNCVS